MSSETVGLRFLGAVVSKADVKAFLKHRDARRCLREGPERDVDTFVSAFLQKHGKFPEVVTVQEQTGILLDAQTEPPSFYAELVKKRFTTQTLKHAVVETSEMLNPQSVVDPYAALAKLNESMQRLRNLQQGLEVHDLRQAKEIVLPMYLAKQAGTAEAEGIKMGWPTLDAMSGGIGPGDVISIVGRPGQGKSQMLLYSAMQMWATGKVPLFISMEMRVSKLMQRLTAMHSHTKLTNQMLGQLTKGVPGASFDKFMQTLLGLSKAEHPFHLVDGNLTAMVRDIADLTAQLKPDVVIVDGAYLLRHPERLDRYTRVAENCDLLKQVIAGDLEVPVIPTWQFARTAVNLKKGEKPGLEHIGYSDVIGQISSLVLGLFEEDSVETLSRRRVEVLKGRDGEIGAFEILWDWDYMNFGEVVGADKEELSFV